MANVLGELFQDIANAIRSKNGATGSMKPAQFPVAIAGIEVGADTDEINLLLDEINGEVVGQKLCHVTVMTEDGMEEIFKIPVYEGYDAENPIGNGVLGIPTKESTETQVFTYTGLSLTPGGEADELALKNVIDDRTVYLAFKASIRYYTVRFFDGDTLKKTMQVMYNMPASYSLPGREGWLFSGWEPSNKNITADTDCYAVWEEQMNFADATWAKIDEICKSGKAAEHFAIDDEREIVGSDGTTEYVLRIVGINLDTVVMGGEKKCITVAITKPGRVTVGSTRWNYDNYNKLGRYWDYDSDASEESHTRYSLNRDFLPKLPTELQNIIKPVRKRTVQKVSPTSGSMTYAVRESHDTLFVPSECEVFGESTVWPENGVVYPGFATVDQRTLYGSDGSRTPNWCMRSSHYTESNGQTRPNLYNHDNNAVMIAATSTLSSALYPCFCI